MTMVSVIGINGEEVKKIELPKVFSFPIREDIIHKVYETMKHWQPYGAYLLAGKEASASSKESHRRRRYKTLYGAGISRIPRKIHSRRGEQFYWVGAFIPGTVGGREAHPPKPLTKSLKINKKEKKIAINSAIAATASKEILKKKYPKINIPEKLPIVIDSSLLGRKEVIEIISKTIGIKIKREKKIRSGKGKRRGRKYKKISKVLLVVSEKEDAKKIRNLGVDILNTKQLNIMALAPGGAPGRITVWTDKALEELK